MSNASHHVWLSRRICPIITINGLISVIHAFVSFQLDCSSIVYLAMQPLAFRKPQCVQNTIVYLLSSNGCYVRQVS